MRQSGWVAKSEGGICSPNWKHSCTSFTNCAPRLQDRHHCRKSVQDKMFCIALNQIYPFPPIGVATVFGDILVFVAPSYTQHPAVNRGRLIADKGSISRKTAWVARDRCQSWRRCDLKLVTLQARWEDQVILAVT